MRLSAFRRAALAATASLLACAGSAGASVPHTVEPGETLWSIAAASNLTTRTLAAANGLPAEANVVIGSTIQVPSESEGAAALAGSGGAGATPGPGSGASGASPGPATADPPTGATLGPAGVGSIASQHGVPPALAAAIAHQESGFNNSVVSPAGARGVMQVLPGTFDYVHRVLGAGPHDPSSPQQNTRAGVIYVRQLLRETGGDEGAAAASYYQGPTSVRQSGQFPDTQRYVANVMALKARYGG